MKKEEKCAQLCVPSGSSLKLGQEESDLLVKRISEDYHVHLVSQLRDIFLKL